MYRISRNGHELITDVNQVEAIEPAVRSSKPRRYDVDEISSGPLPSGHTSRRWRAGIKRADGSVVIEPNPCEHALADDHQMGQRDPHSISGSTEWTRT